MSDYTITVTWNGRTTKVHHRDTYSLAVAVAQTVAQEAVKLGIKDVHIRLDGPGNLTDARRRAPEWMPSAWPCGCDHGTYSPHANV